ncbi:MAG: hypothetical protein H6737_02645 [Alphaproteobacteria bacterium]|nr:hypothetical protein [Alphaproteobacteria bacterium]
MGLASRRRVGLLLWIVGAVVAFVWASVRMPDEPAMVGLGRAVVIEVSALEEGRLASLEVDLHDMVGAGQVVARIDPRPLELLREVEAAELLSLAGPSPEDLQTELKEARRRSKRIEKRAELAAVQASLARLRELLADGAASQAEIDGLESRRARLVADLAAEPGEEDEAPSTWSVVAAAKRLDALDARIEAFQLRSTLGGQVTAVHRRPGEVVRRGEPVLQVRQAQTDEVIAWVPAGAAVGSGTPMTVVRADGTELSGAVVSVGAGPTLLPERTWRDPRRQEWGVAIRLRLAEGEAVLPDEPVVVRL